MVCIKFTSLLLGLFTTCFILVAAFHLRHGDVHRDDLADAGTDVASPEGVLSTSVGEKKTLFRERKFLRNSKAKVDGSAYKINNGDSKSSEKSSSSLKPSDGFISPFNFQVKSAAVVGVSKSHLSSQNEQAESQSKSQIEDEVQKFDKAASQLVNFMHKDYGGMDRPLRKPPVHNDEPFH